MSARFTLSDLPEKYQAQAQSQMNHKADLSCTIREPVSSPTPTDKTPTMPRKPAKNRIRQNASGLNKTEQAFLDWLSGPCREYGKPILSQCITLKIGNGVRYTP